MEKKLDLIVTRLENVCKRLEALEQKMGMKSGGGIMSGTTKKGPVEGYEEMVLEPVNKLKELSDKIGGDVQTCFDFMQKSFLAEKEFIEKAIKIQKPKDEDLQKMVNPIFEHVGKASNFKEKSRRSQYWNEISSIADGLSVVSWFLYEKPLSTLKELAGGGTFWANKIIKDEKEGDQNRFQWAKQYNAVMLGLQGYVKEYHITGFKWKK
ncbi:adenylyl cyclase-associated protein [Anaeramoeba flamelloides]|uniref:Adenylyl cyclase-associated protein n=1 Tax=Anaeramoeba flamelloides TaxID=1746091 RepID=A0ABQ8XIQ3_9EUKA|nr:adenylyl cyclase-associated protein [Anaeramoeba flamelloides]